jgi:hypothetical protein
MIEFITCPICSGHEKLSAEAADRLATAIYNSIHGWTGNEPWVAELENIRNVILNRAERRLGKHAIDPLLL